MRPPGKMSCKYGDRCLAPFAFCPFAFAFADVGNSPIVPDDGDVLDPLVPGRNLGILDPLGYAGHADEPEDEKQFLHEQSTS